MIEKAAISGDFFLEPDDALERINDALTGVPMETSATQLTTRVRAALDGAVPLGFTPDAVAVAVRRAVSGATTWTDHEWQFVHGEPYEPALQMAVDEVLAEQVGAGERPPTLRIWEWASNAVIIGSFQSVGNEVDLRALPGTTSTSSGGSVAAGRCSSSPGTPSPTRCTCRSRWYRGCPGPR